MTVAVDDELWSAVGDPTRRRLLDLLLRDGPGTATSLSRDLPVTRQAVAKHLAVLDRVGLVHAAPAGREVSYDVDERQLARAVAQLEAVGSEWDRRLERIARIASRALESLDRYAATLPADGAIDEGVAYWWNGAARMLECLDLVERLTDGALDATGIPVVGEVLRFPLRMQLGDDWYVNVADGPARTRGRQPWHVPFRWGRRLGASHEFDRRPMSGAETDRAALTPPPPTPSPQGGREHER